MQAPCGLYAGSMRALHTAPAFDSDAYPIGPVKYYGAESVISLATNLAKNKSTTFI